MRWIISGYIKYSTDLGFLPIPLVQCSMLNFFYTVHSPLFFRKIFEIEHFALRAAILHECQNYLGGGGGLEGSEKNKGTVITSLQLVFRRRDRNFMSFTIH